MITLKLSTKTNGIVYNDISEDKVIELVHANVGVKGPRKITIEWTVDDADAAVAKPIEVTNKPYVDKEIPTPPSKNEHNLSESHQSDLSVVLSKNSRINHDEFTTNEFIQIEPNLYFAETSDGRITIKYAGTRVDTTWAELVCLEQSVEDPIPRGVAVLKENDSGNRRTAVTRFINNMRSNDVKQGDGIKLFNKSNNKGKDSIDPDADFRATGVGSSVYPPASPAGQDFGDG